MQIVYERVPNNLLKINIPKKIPTSTVVTGIKREENRPPQKASIRPDIASARKICRYFEYLV